jgi:signal transduction histidine kinase
MKLKTKFLLLFSVATASGMLAVSCVGYFFMQEQLMIAVPETALHQVIATMKQQFAMTTIFVILLIIGINLLFSRHFISLTAGAAIKPTLSATNRRDELGQLPTSCNEELSNTLQQLQQAQMQMIQSEKMAALGNLVAGIAHEINTPVGVGVTASSHLAQITEEFFALYEKGNLTRENLLNYITDTREAAKILLTNLERAAELTRSLKQVSADQCNENKRIFNVKKYIAEVLLSLQPKLKKTKHSIIVQCDEVLEIDTLPGPFSQIITNLIMNSLLHAYDQTDAGKIVVNFVKNNNHFILTYSDDGKGMDTTTVSKIFEPFFTTKPNAGGTGLGLYVLYNIVDKQLGGTIECKSKLGEGATFIIRFPLSC